MSVYIHPEPCEKWTDVFLLGTIFLVVARLNRQRLPFKDAKQSNKSERVVRRGTESVCGRSEADRSRMQTSAQEVLPTFPPNLQLSFKCDKCQAVTLYTPQLRGETDSESKSIELKHGERSSSA